MVFCERSSVGSPFEVRQLDNAYPKDQIPSQNRRVLSSLHSSTAYLMGLLYQGTTLPWDDAKIYADHMRNHGITQFMNIWDRLKDRHGDELLVG